MVFKPGTEREEGCEAQMKPLNYGDPKIHID